MKYYSNTGIFYSTILEEKTFPIMSLKYLKFVKMTPTDEVCFPEIYWTLTFETVAQVFRIFMCNDVNMPPESPHSLKQSMKMQGINMKKLHLSSMNIFIYMKDTH